MSDFDLHVFLPYQLAVATEAVSQDLAHFYKKPHGLSRAEWRVICHLARSDKGLSIRDLEIAVHLEKSKTSRVVSRLEKRQWVRKSNHPDDARLISVSLTPTGFGVYNALVPIAINYQQKLESKFSKADFAVLTRLLDKLSEQ